MIEKKVYQFPADAGDSGFDPACIDITGWERARFQLEAGAVALAACVFDIYFGITPTDLRSPPDLAAAQLTFASRITPEFDIRSLSTVKISLTTTEASLAPVIIYVLLSRKTYGPTQG